MGAFLRGSARPEKEPVMPEPGNSNTAQQHSDAAKPATVKLDPLANRTVPEGDAAAVHGGEEAKPGQIPRDDDMSPSDRADFVRARVNRVIPPNG